MLPFERETIVNFNEEESVATVYTHNKSLINKLRRLLAKETDRIEDAITFEVPKDWISIRPKKVMNISEEDKERMRKSAKENFKIRREKR